MKEAQTCFFFSNSSISAASLSANCLLQGSNRGEGSVTGPTHSLRVSLGGKFSIGHMTTKAMPTHRATRCPKVSCLQSNLGGVCDILLMLPAHHGKHDRLLRHSQRNPQPIMESTRLALTAF